MTRVVGYSLVVAESELSSNSNGTYELFQISTEIS